jgi:hypothetical protein
MSYNAHNLRVEWLMKEMIVGVVLEKGGLEMRPPFLNYECVLPDFYIFMSKTLSIVSLSPSKEWLFTK